MVSMQPRWDFVRLVSMLLAGLALCGGVVSFAGWALDTPAFIDWWNTGITIKTNTSLCVVFLASALLLYQGVRARIAALVLASLAGVVGGATLLEHVAGVNLGIDTLLFQEPPGSPATASPNRMGQPAAISFMLLAVSFWLLVRRSASLLSMALPIVVLAFPAAVGAACFGLRVCHYACTVSPAWGPPVSVADTKKARGTRPWEAACPGGRLGFRKVVRRPRLHDESTQGAFRGGEWLKGAT